MVFIVAEAGSNWRVGSPERDVDMAKCLIDLAAEAGADAVKFQCFRATTTYASGSGACDHLASKGIEGSIQDIFRSLEMPYDMIPKLAEHCAEAGIEFMSSFFSAEDFAAVDPFVKRHKIASPELHHPRLVELAARSGKPTFLSTGISTEEEVAWAVETYRAAGGEELSLWHCTVAYPTSPSGANLAVVQTLKERFGLPVGLSDHTRDPILAPVMAVAMGAVAIEKHFTLHNRMVGPDHSWAITGEELAVLVSAVREAEQMVGDGRIEVEMVEEPLRSFSLRRIHAMRKIAKGEPLLEGENFDILRSGKQCHGAHPRHLGELVGARATREIAAGEGICEGDWETGD